MERDTQQPHVLARAAVILEAIASSGATGARLLDLAESTQLARPTVHRILGTLKEIGYVRQLENRRYLLDRRLGVLALAAPSPIDHISELQDLAQDLANQLGDTVYMATRYFDGVYYLARAVGSFPIRAETVSVGDVLPLTMTYSGIAILSQLPEDQQEELLSRLHQNEHDQWTEIGTEEHEQVLRRALTQFRRDGYLYGSDYVIPGLSGAAVLVPGAPGSPLVSLSVSAIHSRLPESREREIFAALRSTARRVSQVFSGPALR